MTNTALATPKRITRIAQLPSDWLPFGRVIDPYAGHRSWWRGWDMADVTFTDKFFHENGNLNADARFLPFPDGWFDQGWVDPPHLIRKSPFVATSRMFRRSMATDVTQKHGYFGTYPDRQSLRTEWAEVANELHRVLTPGGVLVWKSIDKAKTASKCVNYQDLLDTVSPYFRLVDELRFPSVMSWSTAETVYTRWFRNDRA